MFNVMGESNTHIREKTCQFKNEFVLLPELIYGFGRTGEKVFGRGVGVFFSFSLLTVLLSIPTVLNVTRS